MIDGTEQRPPRLQQFSMPLPPLNDHSLFSGLIPLHVLHYACRGPIFGLKIIEHLARHDYRLSAGTIYPLLHRLEQHGALRSREQLHDGRIRRIYRATPLGHRMLAHARNRVAELLKELMQDQKRSLRRKVR